MTSMSAASSVVLLLAGVMAGAVNAIAGGGTLISFPALLAVGLPPVVAAASNAVAVWPGHAFATVTYRRTLRETILVKVGLASVCLAGILGGAVGAAALRASGESVFAVLVPPLIALATCIFAAGPRLATHRALQRTPGNVTCLAAVFTTSVYGGFFGAGLGVMLMAVLLLLGVDGAQRNNALKNLVATCVTTSSVVFLIASGLVAWTPTLIMTIGAFLGGFWGARLAQRIAATHLRLAVICLGAVLTIFYAVKYWA